MGRKTTALVGERFEVYNKLLELGYRISTARKMTLPRFIEGAKLVVKESRVNPKKDVIPPRRDSLLVQPQIEHKDVIYLSGIFDGEGCIIIASNGGINYWLSISISNTHPGVMIWLKSKFRGSVYFRPKFKEHHRPVGCWNATGDLAAWILESIKPYSIIKRRQIALALDFYKVHKLSLHNGSVSKDIMEMYKKKISECNNSVEDYNGLESAASTEDSLQ